MRRREQRMRHPAAPALPAPPDPRRPSPRRPCPRPRWTCPHPPILTICADWNGTDMLPLNPALAATFRPPVMEARRWLDGVSFSPDRPLINVSQAAPVDPPPEPLRRAIADAALNRAEAHLYGPVLGNSRPAREGRAAVEPRLRRHRHRRACGDHARLQPGVLRRHGDACRRGGRGHRARAVVLQPCDVAADAGRRGRAAALRAGHGARPRTGRRPDHRAHARHRAGQPQQSVGCGIPARGDPRILRSGAGARDRAGRR